MRLYRLVLLTSLVTTPAYPQFLQAPYQLQNYLPSFSNLRSFVSYTGGSLSSSFLTKNTSMPRGAVISIAHGGGPMPLLNEPGHKEVINSFKTRVPSILRLNDPANAPKAIIVVTAHWSARVPSISSQPSPALLYDYYGFPAETYNLTYPAPGAPELATQVAQALTQAGFKPRLDAERGWDHGVFVPLLLIHPKANIPVLQLSVLDSEDPAEHFRMGRALARFRDENIAIIASGSATFHNMREMRNAMSDMAWPATANKWSETLHSIIEDPDVERRGKRLEKWREIKDAYRMHPRGGAEHFLPLIVAAGAGGEDPASHYTDTLFGTKFYNYYWQ